MKTLIALVLLTALAAVGAEDPWAKVHELKSGTELRIFKKGVRQPVLATYEDLNDDSLIIATKKEEMAIAKDQIERVDFRPKAESRVTKETRTTVTDPDPAAPENRGTLGTPGSSTSTNLSLGRSRTSKRFIELFDRASSNQAVIPILRTRELPSSVRYRLPKLSSPT